MKLFMMASDLKELTERYGEDTRVIDIIVNYSKKVAKVTTQHAGYMCCNGGEYGMGYSIYKTVTGFIRKYWTTSDFAICEVCGSWSHQHQDCCAGVSQYATDEYLKLCAKYPSETENGQVIDIDNCDHNIIWSEMGGRKICHPYTR